MVKMPDHACWSGWQISCRNLTGLLHIYWFTNCNYCRVSLCIIYVWTTRISRCMIVFLLLPFLSHFFTPFGLGTKAFLFAFFVLSVTYSQWNMENYLQLYYKCVHERLCFYLLRDTINGCMLYEIWMPLPNPSWFDESLRILLNWVNFEKSERLTLFFWKMKCGLQTVLFNLLLNLNLEEGKKWKNEFRIG